MSKNFYIFHGHNSAGLSLSFRLLEALAAKGNRLFFCSIDPQTAIGATKKTRAFFLGPDLENRAGRCFFLLVWPVLVVFWIIRLAAIKYRGTIDATVCLTRNDKLVISPAARLLKIKTIWLENIEEDYSEKRPWRWLFRLAAGQMIIAAFSKHQAEKINAAGIFPTEAKVITPGAISFRPERQDTIFSELARAANDSFHKKFFTVGAIMDLNKEQKIEALFGAVKICLPIINNLQLVIVGEGEERKALGWLAKKMEIDPLVWFVGENSRPKKWLDSFDVFVEAKNKIAGDDFETVVRAMAAGRSVIAPADTVFADIITNGQNGLLFDIENGEELAAAIIRLYKDKAFRLALGAAAQKTALANYTISRMVDDFEKLL